MLSFPVLLGFDLDTDLTGRWTGVLTSLGSVLLVCLVLYKEIKK
jgi:hypothetical protein